MQPELSAAETQALIDYARRKYAEERWPLSTALRPIRDIITEARSQARTDPDADTEALCPEFAREKEEAALMAFLTRLQKMGKAPGLPCS